MQSTNNIFMIRPVNFGFNAQTADSNAFQIQQADQQAVQQKAVQEFDGFVNVLRENGVNVTVIEDTPEPHTPDSIFPNNWVSFMIQATSSSTPCKQKTAGWSAARISSASWKKTLQPNIS
jgi:hypothetical protein